MPIPARLSYEECRKRSVDGTRRYWDAERPARAAARAAVRDAAAAEVGPLTDREILLTGAIAYWCEGAKNKQWRRDDRIVFTNSDPSLISFFLRFLAIAGVTDDRLSFRVLIHETADVEAAERFWLGTTGASPDQFHRAAVKRHNPKTVRKNVGDGYYGCLRIDVHKSSDLYYRIEGWTAAITAGIWSSG